MVVAVGIGKQFKVGALRNVNARSGVPGGGDLKADRHVQPPHKNGLFIGFAVVVGIFQNEQFIVGLGIAGFVVRIRSAW